MKRIIPEQALIRHIPLEERIEHICNHPIFCLLTAESTQQLALLMNEIYIQTNDVIVREGDYFDGFFLIISGEAAVFKSLKRIKKTIPKHVITLGPTNAIGIGQAGFFSQQGLRNATVTALSPMILLHIDLHKFYYFLKEHGSAYPSLKNMSEKFLLLHFIRENPHVIYPEPGAKQKSITAKEQNNVILFKKNQKPNISLPKTVILKQINDKSTIEDILKDELNELDADQSHLIITRLQKLGFKDFDLLVSPKKPKKSSLFKQIIRKITHYWKGKNST